MSLERSNFKQTTLQTKLFKASSLLQVSSQNFSNFKSTLSKCDSHSTLSCFSLLSPVHWLPLCPMQSTTLLCIMLTVVLLLAKQKHYPKLPQLNWKLEDAIAQAACPAKHIPNSATAGIAATLGTYPPFAMLI
jgi:hypothetical protein